MPRVRIERSAVVAPAPRGTLRAGAAVVDVTPPIGFPMAGYSTQGRSGAGVAGRLFARALYLEDARGGRVALVAMDLMSASRYLLESAAVRTAPWGVGVDRLVLCGTHTHTGPGWFYGCSLYDTFAAAEAGFDADLADWIAGRVAVAVVAAIGSAVPARVGFATRACWDVARNRSHAAFLGNPQACAWGSGGWPGAGAPPWLTVEQRAVDPRVRVVAAFDRASGTPIGAFGTFGCHATATGVCTDVYSSDWPGYAVRTARAELARRHGGSTVVALGLSGAGDTNAMRTDTSEPLPAGFELAARAGFRVGAALADAVDDAARTARDDLAVEVRYDEMRTTCGGDPVSPADALAPTWAFGAPTIGGSEESRTPFHRNGLVREGMTSDEFPPGHPQHPKVQALGAAQDALKGVLGLAPGARLPLHAVRVGALTLVTVPGEPTATAAHEIERAVRSATGAGDVYVLGYAGDYSGYVTTPAEFDAQHYEGASTIHGRTTLAHLVGRLVALASGRSAGAAEASVAFRVGRPRRRFLPGESCSCVEPSPTVERRDDVVTVRWQMAEDAHVVFALAPWVRVEVPSAAPGWRPALHLGRDFDDRNHVIAIRRESRTTWSATLRLPEEARTRSRVRVMPRDLWPGFVIDVPA